MSKRTRFKYCIAQQRGGSPLEKSADYTLTENDILLRGYSHIKASGISVITLPAASANLEGMSIIVTSTGQASAFVAAGFGGGGASYDTVQLGRYESAEFWCDGDYWYALTTVVGGTTSSSSSSSSSSSFSSSSSSSSEST